MTHPKSISKYMFFFTVWCSNCSYLLKKAVYFNHIAIGLYCFCYDSESSIITLQYHRYLVVFLMATLSKS